MRTHRLRLVTRARRQPNKLKKERYTLFGCAKKENLVSILHILHFYTMHSLEITFILSIFLSSFVSSNILQMINQLKCASGRSRYEFYDLSNYGCWCGVGGSGRPIDRIDRCCWAHDKCFEQARTQDFKCNPKKIMYSWSCDDDLQTGVCENVVNDESRDNVKCARASCICDSVFARCVSKGKMDRKYHKISEGEQSGRCKKRKTVDEVVNFVNGLYWEIMD